jgi:peptidoglycan hydrolase-like protein with peptidoglycan-binding domain
MSKAGGLVLILSGLAGAAYVLTQMDIGDQEPTSQRTEVAKTIVAQEHASSPIIAPEPRPAFRPAASRTPEAVPAFSAPVVVTIAQRPSEPPAPAPQRVAVPKDRDTLTRELQKELRRVGCYEGELNGAWTPMTRRAMKAFTDRINATLPVEEPDAILYTMVQSQQDKVCGKPCPAGQGLSEDGRCLPSAILAKAARKTPTPATTVAQLPRTAVPPPAEKPAPVITGWSTTSRAAAPTPPLAPAPALAAAPAATPLGPAPTEGRMALAGPAVEPEAFEIPSPVVKPQTRTRSMAHGKRPRGGTSVARTPQRGTFVGMFFRRNDSRL